MGIKDVGVDPERLKRAKGRGEHSEACFKSNTDSSAASTTPDAGVSSPTYDDRPLTGGTAIVRIDVKPSGSGGSRPGHK